MTQDQFSIQDISRILVVQKKTKFELDMEIYSSLEEYKKICKLQNFLYDKIFQSHERQEQSREYLRKKVIPNAKFIFRDDLNSINLDEFDLIISLGGDNHFTFVAHQVSPKLILGLNSDPDTSVGALLGFSTESFEQLVQNNWNGAYVEEWSLIHTTLTYPDGRIVETFPSVSEISIRNNSPDLISRYLIEYKDDIEEQKSSGLLLYTGAGSTGWVASCYPKKTGPFPKDKRYFQVYAREPRRKDKTYEHFHWIDFRVEDSVEVVSEMNGGISIDSLAERNYLFPPGTRAKFTLGNTRLKVVIAR
ncbi:MAG: NAD+ kinase [Leptospira sp.]|nr:NAD+ kinase [Leptospira sp.]NCS94031.1 NAD+ kinase [Leptospira sp.]